MGRNLRPLDDIESQAEAYAAVRARDITSTEITTGEHTTLRHEMIAAWVNGYLFGRDAPRQARPRRHRKMETT